MYARLRQKLAIPNSSTTVTTTTALGNNAISLVMKDLVRLMTGAVTSTAGLNSEIWDAASSEIINTVPAGWSEYQTTYSTTSTNIPSTSSGANMMYLRALSQNNTYKYTGLSWTANANANAYYRMLFPYDVTDYTGNPTLSFRDSTGSASAAGPCVYETTGVLHEHVLYVSPRCIFWSISRTTASQPYYIHTCLEYPNTALSQAFNHPNQLNWSLFNGIGATTTGTGATFVATGYNQVGGYNTTGVLVANSATNQNIGFVYTNSSNMPAGGTTAIWSAATAAADASTLKPTSFGSMGNTVDLAGNTVTIPAMPLVHYPAWDSVYDCSSLTGIYATKPGLGATGDTLTLNGQTYVYVNATTMGYLLPRQ